MHRKWFPLILGAVLAFAVSAMPLFAQQAIAADSPPWIVKKRGVEMDIRSEGRMRRDSLATYGKLKPNRQQSGNFDLSDLGSGPQIPIPQGNIQVNDGKLDHVLRVSGVDPLVLYTQNEPVFAVYGRNIVAAYNTSVFATDFNTDIQFFNTLFGTGFSPSTDGGRTWTSGFLPPVRNASYTFGDPTVAVDRQGNFYATSLGVDADFNGKVQINKSTNGGRAWSEAVIVGLGKGNDKPGMAVDPES